MIILLKEPQVKSGQKMPRLSQWYIKSVLLYLLAGFSIGMLMLANKGVPFYPALWRLLPVHIEFLLMGWTLQFVLGVAFWIAPRFWQAPRRGDERGAVAAWILLNLGIWAVVMGVWLAVPSLILPGRVLEVTAVFTFVLHIWPRIVGRES